MKLCQRDKSHGVATYRVTSDEINMPVCDACADAAYDLVKYQKAGSEGAIDVQPLSRRERECSKN